jgi:hypothetical protein
VVPCNATDGAQQWQARGDGSLFSPSTALCLDAWDCGWSSDVVDAYACHVSTPACGGATSLNQARAPNGAGLMGGARSSHPPTCHRHHHPTQVWQLPPAGTTGPIVSALPNATQLCLTTQTAADGSGGSAGATVTVLGPCAGGAQWYAEASTGLLRLGGAGGQQCLTASPPPPWQAFARPLADGDIAVVLLNRAEVAQQLSVTWAEVTAAVGAPAWTAATVRDMWQHAMVASNQAQGYGAAVQPHGVAAWRLTRTA